MSAGPKSGSPRSVSPTADPPSACRPSSKIHTFLHKRRCTAMHSAGDAGAQGGRSNSPGDEAAPDKREGIGSRALTGAMDGSPTDEHGEAADPALRESTRRQMSDSGTEQRASAPAGPDRTRNDSEGSASRLPASLSWWERSNTAGDVDEASSEGGVTDPSDSNTEEGRDLLGNEMAFLADSMAHLNLGAGDWGPSSSPSRAKHRKSEARKRTAGAGGESRVGSPGADPESGPSDPDQAGCAGSTQPEGPGPTPDGPEAAPCGSPGADSSRTGSRSRASLDGPRDGDAPVTQRVKPPRARSRSPAPSAASPTNGVPKSPVSGMSRARSPAPFAASPTNGVPKSPVNGMSRPGSPAASPGVRAVVWSA